MANKDNCQLQTCRTNRLLKNETKQNKTKTARKVAH